MSDSKTTRSKVRINLEISALLHAELVAIADDAECSMSDLFKQGFALLIAANAGRARGMHLGICSRPGVLNTEFVGLL